MMWPRLVVLRKMGLAEPTGPTTWRLRQDFEQVLRAMQRTTDRQRTLAAHGVLMSDERLPIEVLDLSQIASVEGRVLVHGQDEQTGRTYLMLEGTDAKIPFHPVHPGDGKRPEAGGELRTNSFVRLRRLSLDQGEKLDVRDLGDAERVLTDPHYMSGAARHLLEHGIIPIEDGWGGWLGKYQAGLRNAAREIVERQVRDRTRSRDRSLGR